MTYIPNLHADIHNFASNSHIWPRGHLETSPGSLPTHFRPKPCVVAATSTARPIEECPINLKQLPDWALRPLSALRQAEPAGDHLVSTQAHALRLRAEARGLVLTTQTLYLPYCRALHLSRLVVHPLSSPSCIVYCLLIVCTFCSYAQIHRNRARLGLRYTAIPEALGAFETAASRCTGLYRRKQRIE